ncbi:hypothetical protein [Fluviicola chungangensis]|uniref:Carboxypeptidase regulatory-like domain-containing protein n=1 Tax=Fluviicola chungangensis TaxID=2597671 RepID=A0A556MNK4_9FLAO|nr:hypothetical protein [Fluviicola chungangensis]TSJ41547.1 hypothetical protein FO442_13870 [Fluviicola chungangensis]
MKTKTVQYTIQDPCDKSWKAMTPEANGRFCGACEKSVVDFTRMSDFLIVSYLENHKQEKVCGRFTKPQLDRVYQLNQPVFAPSFDLRAFVLGLALTTFSAVHGFSKTDPRELVKTDTLAIVPPVVVGTVAHVHFDHEKEKKASGSIQNALSDFKEINVVLKTSEGKILKEIHPDAKGKFEFDLDWKLKPAFIEISGIGYETQEMYFCYMRSLSNVEITLLDEVQLFLGEVIQGDVKATEDSSEDPILQTIEMGNVGFQKGEE